MQPEVSQSESLLKLWAWILENQKRLLTLLVILLGVAFVAFAYSSYRESHEKDAGYALSKVLPARFKDAPSAAEQAQAYLKVAQDYPGTSAARQALLRAGSALFNDGKYAEAKAQFEAFAQQDPGSFFASQAEFGIAAALDAQGKTDEAIAKYEDVARRFPTEGVAEKSKLAIAALYTTQKKHEQAYKLYEELMKTSRGSMSSQLAFSKHEELATQFPHLRTNALATSTTVTPALNNAANALKSATNAAVRALSNTVAAVTNQVLKTLNAATNKLSIPAPAAAKP